MVRGWTFHITGGALCLDFANTLSWRRSPAPTERINTLADFASWARQTGLIARRDESRIIRSASPGEARRTLRAARSLRETIFAIFAAISEGRPPADRDLDLLARWIRDAVDHSRLRRAAGRFRWEPETRGVTSAEEVLWQVALSAQEVLTALDTVHIGQCSGRDCRWLWVDRTRNHSRRWCDMAVCGNRAKARRHYERLTAHAG